MLTKIDKNLYELMFNNAVIKFEIDCDEEINIENQDMSIDKIIFIGGSLPTPDDEIYPIIGHAYKYNDNGNMIKDWLVGVTIIFTNVDLITAKNILEVKW